MAVPKKYRYTFGDAPFADFPPQPDGDFDPEKGKDMVTALVPFLKMADEFRSKAVTTCIYNAAYRDNRYLIDTAGTRTMSPKVSILKKLEQAAHDKYDYYSINANVGQAERRKSNIESMKVGFDVVGMTRREMDRLTAEVGLHLSNNYIAPKLREILWVIADKLTYTLHPIVGVEEWDDEAGPVRRVPRVTLEPTCRNYEGEEVKNKPIPAKTWKSKKESHLRKAVERLFNGGEEKPVFHQRDAYEMLVYDEVPTGLPRFEVYDPLAYLIDPNCGWRGVAHAGFVATQRRLSAEKIFEMFRDDERVMGQLKKFDGWSRKLCVSEAQVELNQYVKAISESEYINTGLVTDVYFRPSPALALNHGMRAIVISELNIDEADTLTGAVLKWDELPTPKDLPFRDGSGALAELANSNDYYGSSVFTQTAPLQKGMNEMFSRSIQAAKNASRQKVGVSGVSSSKDIGVESVDALGVDVVYTKGGEKISVLDHSSAQYLIQSGASKAFLEGFALLSQQGTPTERGEDYAAQVNRRMMYEAIANNALRERVGSLFAEIGILALRKMQRHNSIDDFKLMLPDRPVQQLREFKEADLCSRSIMRITRTSIFVGNPMLRLDFFRMFAQADPGLIAQHMDPAQIREFLDFSDQFGTGDYQRHVELAEVENSMILGGQKSSKVPVKPYDNHMAHIPMHIRLGIAPDRNEMPLDIMNVIDNHLKEHFVQLEQQQKAQVRQLVEAQVYAKQLQTPTGGGGGEGAQPSEQQEMSNASRI